MKSNNLVKKLGALLLCAALMVTTACNSPTVIRSKTDDDIIAIGRYIESDVNDLEGVSFSHLTQLSDGRVIAGTYDDEGSRWFFEFVGSTFTPYGDVNYFEAAMSALEGGYYSAEYTFDSEGNYYQYMIPYTDEGLQDALIRVDAEGNASIVNMDWQQKDNGEVMVSHMSVDSDGNIVVSQVSQGIYRYSPHGEFLDCYMSDTVISYVVTGKDAAIMDKDTGTLIIYDMDSQRVKSSIPVESINTDGMLVTDQQSSIYHINRSGIFKYVEGGDVIEKIVDGELNSLSIPSLMINSAAYINDEFLIKLSDISTYESKMIRMSYSADTPSKPDVELTVYTLYDNNTVRQAIGQFQRNNPNVKINVQAPLGNKNSIKYSISSSGVGMKEVDTDQGAVDEDIVRALNTELLNGKGPDIIILDDLPERSYVEKGVLADISHIIKPMISSGQLLENIVSAYDGSEGMYAVPVRFSLPVMFTEQDHVDMTRSLQSLADFAREHQDMPALKKYTPAQLLEVFYYVCEPELLKDGAIDRDAFIRYISYLKDIYDASWPQGMENAETSSLTSKHSMSIFDWQGGGAYAGTYMVKSFKNTILLSSIKQFDEAIMTFLPGFTEGVFEPVCTVEINANTDKMELAGAFIETMLSTNVQASDLNEGFPVNSKIYEDKASLTNTSESITWYVQGTDSDGNKVDLRGGEPSGDDLQPLIRLCQNARTPVTFDSILMGIFIDKTVKFFIGVITAEEAADAVIVSSRLYLSE